MAVRPGRVLLRTAAVIALLAIALFVVRHGAATVARRADPTRAVALAPWDARALAARAEAVLGDGSKPADRAGAERLARRALRRDATNASAVTTLGFVTQVRDPGAAERLFRYAESLSRRELRAQIWMIENAVSKGRVREALDHYDVALRASSAAPALLHPVLATAIADPPIRRALVDILRRKPAWSASFLTGLAINGPDFTAAAALLTDLRGRGVAVPAAAVSSLVVSLAARGDYELAWRLFADETPGLDRLRVRDGSFTIGDPVASPFNWSVSNDGGFSATIGGGSAGQLDVRASPTVGGVAARQLQLLTPGAYRLSTRARVDGQPPESQPYWSIACASGRDLARVPMGEAEEDGRIFTGGLVVPTGCPAQWLSLVIVPSDSAEGVTVTIDEIAIEPASDRSR